MASVREWLDRMPEHWIEPTLTDTASPNRLLWWLVRSQRRRVTAGAIISTIWMVGLALPPWILSRAIDDGLVARDGRALLWWALALLVATVGLGLLGILRHRTMTKIRTDAALRGVRVTARHTGALGASFGRQVSAGEVVTIGIADVNALAMALTVTGPGLGAVIAYVVVAALLLAISPLLAVVVLAGVPLLALAIGPLLRRIENRGNEYRVHQGRLSGRLIDALAGLRVLNGLGGKAAVETRFRTASQDLVDRGYRVAGPTSLVEALSTGLPALFLAAVVWLSARMAASGDITIGDVVAVYGYVAVLVIPVTSLIEGAGDLARARVAGQRLCALLRTAPPGPKTSSHSLELHDAQTGFVAADVGLTALVSDRPAESRQVLERLAQLDAPGPVRDRILLADNDAALFSGSVADSVAGRQPLDERRLAAALRDAVAEDIVEALPDGFDTVLSSGAAELSGGQRQRLRLARALYAAPPVLLAVEPTSAVDATTEAAIVERLAGARSGRATVIAASSPLILAGADRVCLLFGGEVVASGRHADLLRDDRRYAAVVSRDQPALDGGAEQP